MISSGILPCSDLLDDYSDINLFLLPMHDSYLRKPGKF